MRLPPLPPGLIALALAAVLAALPVGPRASDEEGDWTLGVNTAHADDDGDDDDGDDDDDDARGNPGSGSDSGERPPASGGGDLLRRLFGRDDPPRASPPPAAPLPLAAPDEIVVAGLAGLDLARLLSEGFVLLAVTDGDEARRVVRLRVPEGLSVDAALGRVGEVAPSAPADRNHFYRPQQRSDCAASVCRDWEAVGWDAAGDRSCVAAVTVGVVDTGVNPTHEAFAAARLELLTTRADGEPPSDLRHGTAVVSLLAGEPAGRVPGLVPEARIVAADPFARVGSDERADTFGLLAALDAVRDAGARVVNLSLSGPANEVLEARTAALVAGNVVLVAAVGNAGPRADPQFPAAYEGVIAVTAVDGDGRVYRRAVRGPHVDLAAPGVGVAAAASVRGMRPQTGTSFAAPFVTAAAAVLVGAEPALTPAEVAARLVADATDLGEPGHDDTYGHGLLKSTGTCVPPGAVQAAGPT